ncbi:MAG: hypothetical protein U5O15_04025 [Candidatus Krumholzibacteriota bacterium]|nr:hypothetical protein [Candidatus Krumholzibacteriota bacterium]
MKLFYKYLIAFSFVTFVFLGCASTLEKEMEVDSFLPRGDYSSAIKELSSNIEVFGTKNRLLYLLNAGVIHFYSDNFAESNNYFSEANKLSEILYTKSVSNEAAGLMNPNLIPYNGEDYENVMINVFTAFNYIKLGMIEEAGVEARIINSKLKLLTQKYESENKYKNDALGRYLSGIIYETRGDINNAYISYKKAYEAYVDYKKMFEFKIPGQIEIDILRLAERLGFSEQFKTYSKRFNADSIKIENGNSEIIVFAMTGLCPYKKEFETKFSRADKEGKTHTFQLLIPKLIERGSAVGNVTVKCENDSASIVRNAQIIENISKIAIKNMSDKMPQILIKAWLRAFTKKKASDKMKEKVDTGNVLGNLLVGAVTDGVAEELTHADIRCWRTLPSRIYFRRIQVNPGSYDLEVELRDKYGDCLEKITRKGIVVENERKYFVFVERFI